MDFVDTLLIKGERSSPSSGRTLLFNEQYGFHSEAYTNIWCQEAISALRADFMVLGVFLRPRIFHAARQDIAEPPGEPTSASESSPNKELEYTATQTLYLKTTGAARGVLQVHRDSWLHMVLFLYLLLHVGRQPQI